MLLENLRLRVYELVGGNISVYPPEPAVFDCVGEVNDISSLVWGESMTGYGEFQLTVAYTKANVELLQLGRMIWKGGKKAARIEIMTIDETEDEGAIMIFKGRTLESLLLDRITNPTFYFSGKTGDAVRSVVDKNCINPSSVERQIPFLVLDSNYVACGSKVKVQDRGSQVYDFIVATIASDELYFSIDFDPDNETLTLVVGKGTDRTSDTSKAVIFSKGIDNVVSSEYYKNIQDYKTEMLVAGEGEGVNRVMFFNSIDLEGFDRREIFIDASDLQSTYTNDSGSTVTLSESDYQELLEERANKKAADYSVAETYTAVLNASDNERFVYGVDYFLGDTVTVIDERLGLTTDAKVTAIQETFGDDYSLELTLGYGMPSLYHKLKR